MNDCFAIGYRLVQRLPNGKLIQPSDNGKPIDIELDKVTELDQVTELGQVNVDITGRGYYCFQTREAAENYMRILMSKQSKQPKMGWYEVYRVQGVAKSNNLMDEMVYSPEPLLSIAISDVIT